MDNEQSLDCRYPLEQPKTSTSATYSRPSIAVFYDAFHFSICSPSPRLQLTAMQTYTHLLTPAAVLLALVAGLLDTAASQSVVEQIAEIGSVAVSNAALTSSLTSSVRDALAPFADTLGGQAQQAVQHVVDLANANAVANNELNNALQSLLDSAQTFSQADDNAASILNNGINGIRRLRMEKGK
ncbi:unnamed protein product [Phytophthora lilii]|uniref:Unnamed protein product n=1 Tax=Phytophthora lilii TaxID=2077276 RepID=A0A9W6TDV0_9STRA|nr:unnamed protein product [Phytophthora lilii]